MYISINWIKDYVDLDGIDIINLIQNRFTMAVAEVEGIQIKGENLSGVVTAKIIKVDDHPNSKKLHILKVDKGDEIVEVVCGAPNVKEGMITALATTHANVLGQSITVSKIAGIDSNGMCCSAKELGISDDHSGIFEFEKDTPVGIDVKKILPIDDIIFEIDNKSLTNRPDLWGHYGIAREISALTHRPLKKLEIFSGDVSNLPNLDIKVKSDTCFRYTSATMKNITKKISPMTMQIRLYYTGMRAINFLADITNYVMLELGQPMHAFDNSLVKKIEVENIDSEVKFTTLDGQERVLPKDTMVIKGNGEISAIAGVMGGLDSEIKDNTTSVLIESACFHPAKVRRTATSIGLRTESSSRYEKSLDPELTIIALKRYINLVKSIDNCAEISSNITDIYNFKYEPVTINITKEYIDNYTGIEFDKDTILSTLKSLEFEVIENGNKYEIHVPSFRATKDIKGKPDIVEEVARIFGYDNIKPVSPNMEVLPVDLNRKIDAEYSLKYTLATKFNLSEIHTYLWYDYETNKYLNINPKSYLKIINSLQKYNDELRTTLIPSQLKVVLENKEDFDNFGVFEIGSAVVGLDKQGQAIEQKKLCITLYNKIENTDKLLELKEMLEYSINDILMSKIKFVKATSNVDYISPKNYYEIICDGETIGFIGMIHPKILNLIDKRCGIVVAELDFNKISSSQIYETKFEKVSIYPKSELDFNFLINKDILYSDIYLIATSYQSDIKYKVSLLDIFDHNEQLKSYTLHYEIWSDNRTLNGDEIDNFHKQIIQTFKDKGIELKL